MNNRNQTKEQNKAILHEVERLQSLWELHDKRVREVLAKQHMKSKSNIQFFEEAERTANRNADRISEVALRHMATIQQNTTQ